MVQGVPADDPVGVTAVNRQVFSKRGNVLVTLSLTSMALRDAETADLFPAVLDAFAITENEETAR